jgi:hypothetical protein
VSVTERRRQLDDRWGMTTTVLRRADRLELERQAEAGDPTQIDPDLERRGRAWAEPLVRPLAQQRGLLVAYLAALAFGVVLALLCVLGYAPWSGAGGAVVVVLIPLSQLVKRRVLRPEARRLLDALPPRGSHSRR